MEELASEINPELNNQYFPKPLPFIEKNGFSALEQGQKILVRLEDGDRGKQVTTIRLYTGDQDLKDQPRL